MSVPERLGDFEIVAEIGRGGFGIVYRARQVSLSRDVALKVLYEHRVHTREEVSRFEREAHAAARLDHPAVVSVYAWGQDQGHFFIAQKLVGDGHTLADRLNEMKSSGEPPKGYFREVAGILARVADGLGHAHEKGVVHRDMKPSNILLDEKGRPYLGDFGLAKVEDGLELSRTGDFAGSPYYMSPEQADSRRGDVDHRADIYGLGVTLYELITLQPPFHGRSPHEIIRKILTEDPRLPTKVAPRVPKDLETICLHAMEKVRTRRYQTAQEFGRDLQAFLDGEPIAAAPISAVSRVWRKARRNRAGVGIVVLVMALLAVSYLLENSSSGMKDAEQKAELAKSVASVSSSLRQEQGERVDQLFTEALEGDRKDEAVKLQAYKGDVSKWLDSGQQLLLDVIPDITDNETLKAVGENLQGQFLYDAVAQIEEYLSTRSSGDEPDPRLAQASSWLQKSTFLRDMGSQLNLTLGDLVGGGAAPTGPAATPQLDLGAVAQEAGQAESAEPGQVLPPTGPAGALGGNRRRGVSSPAIVAPPGTASGALSPGMAVTDTSRPGTKEDSEATGADVPRDESSGTAPSSAESDGAASGGDLAEAPEDGVGETR